MIRANSSVQIQKLQIPLQQISPFNSSIRYSNPYSDAPSTPQRSFFNQQIRGSTPITPNKISQTFCLKENNGSIEARIQSLVNENIYLNQELEKAKNENINNQQQNDQLNFIKQKMGYLEQQVESQVIEIEQWKLKYQKASGGEQSSELASMELQVIGVIQENERLNLIAQQMSQQLTEKEKEIKQLIVTINKQEGEIKKHKDKLIAIEKLNKQVQSWNPDKKLQKVFSSTNEMRQSKCKATEPEVIRKKSDYITSQKLPQKNTVELNDLQMQVTTLQIENKNLQQIIEDLSSQVNQKTQMDQNPNSSLSILKQEISNQQILILEEFKRQKAYQQQHILVKEHVKRLEEQLREFLDNANSESESLIDTTLEEFTSSQMNCLKIVEQLQQQ